MRRTIIEKVALVTILLLSANLGFDHFDVRIHENGIFLDATVELDQKLKFATWEISITQNRTEPTPLASISIYFETDKGGEELIYAGPWSEAEEPKYSYRESGNTSLPLNFSQISLTASITLQGENDRVDFSTEFNITNFLRTENFTGEIPENLPSTFPMVTVLCVFLILGLLSVFLRRR